MPTELRTDPANGVTVAGKSAYYSLGSPLWSNLNGSPLAKYTYNYSKPGQGWDDGEMATMNLAKWDDDWSSAHMRLGVALGFGEYEQSIKVGIGSGVTTTFYLSQYNRGTGKAEDQNQEIDFEFGGHDHTCVQTNVWRKKRTAEEPSQQFPVVFRGLPDSTSGWGFSVYRYKIDWEPDGVTWWFDRTGSGNSYERIHSDDMSRAGVYDESLCYAYISFWKGWTPDGSTFRNGEDATSKCGESGPCYQAFFFQSLKFTPSNHNKLVTLAS